MKNHVWDSYRIYIKKMHTELYKDEPIDTLLVDVYKGHRRKRFIAMYFLSLEKPEFDAYYEKRHDLDLEPLFNQLISTLLHNTEKSPVKKMFVTKLEVKEEMISESVSDYEIKEIEKDLYAFSFSETKKILKEKQRDPLD